ncbi:hypothetical protein IAD21_02429 [Abditibacteriota bacterium]|nr:hypothetical protein IAD21_01222 [Abditibacteriota bacterium]BCM90575.1 hypothetical protein IAD21_02429 [Abditibacteriota bacterium]
MSRKKKIPFTETTAEIILPDCQGAIIEDAFATLGKLARARYEGTMGEELEEGAEVANQDLSFEIVSKELGSLKTYWELERRRRAEWLRNQLALVEGKERY